MSDELDAQIADLRQQMAAAADVEEQQRAGQRLNRLMDRRAYRAREGILPPTTPPPDDK